MKAIAPRSTVLATSCAAALLVLGVLAARWLLQSGDPLYEAEGWPDLAAPRASCKEGPEHAAHAAHAALAIARARLQRYAFAPREGRIALDRFAEAAECAHAAGDGALAEVAAEELASVRARVAADARDHLRRYRHLKARDRLAEAAPDIAYLMDLGWPERGALAESLRRDGARAAALAIEARP